MNTNHFYRTALLVIFIFCSTLSFAKKAPGYIIEDSDTLYGKIKISQFNILTAGLVMNGINSEPLHHEVWFRSNDSKRFKRYNANEIIAFGFTDKTRDYYFKSFRIETNSLVKKEKIRSRFLQLYSHVSNIYLYKDLLRVDNYSRNTYNNPYEVYNLTYTYPEFYLFNSKIGLTKVEETKLIKTIKELLSIYGIEDNFLKHFSKDINIKDIGFVLEEYKLWLKRYTTKSIKI